MSIARPISMPASFLGGLRVQARVVGALILRELHTRYGRNNIGYLWLIFEPLMLGTVIALIHSGQASHGGIHPVAFTVVGYCIFIIFRGIVGRAEGSLEGNAPLLYHKMVTVFDITLARSILEVAGCITAFTLLLCICIALGYTGTPARPEYLLLGIVYVAWFSFSIAMIIVGGTYEKPTLGRLTHPFTYFMIPLSGAFYQLAWIPKQYRDILMWVPFPQMFEVARYGQFQDATLEYVNFLYINGFCMVLSLFGLIILDLSRRRIQLS